MSYRAVINIISLLLMVIGGALVLTTGVSWLMGDADTVVMHFLWCAFGTLAVAVQGYLKTKRAANEEPLETGIREGFAGVGIGWIVGTVAAGIPFMVVLGAPFSDSVFEASSGLTTTGATVVAEGLELIDGSVLVGGVVDGLPKGILFWRAFLNWLGGIGIVFFVLLVLPWLKIGSGRLLYNAEVPGLKTGEQLTPRLSRSVKLMLWVYCLLTMSAALLYHVMGMEWFDAVCHAFATISTGGFSTHADSIAYYKSPMLQWCIIFFMFISACNFSLILKLFMQRRMVFYEDEEFRCFFVMTVLATLFVAGMLYWRCPAGIHMLSNENFPRDAEVYLRTAAFQVVAVVSTTGFCTSDWQQWIGPNGWQPTGVCVLIGMLMIPCGCGGSTAGGLKIGRVIVLFKQLRYEIRRCLSPRLLLDVRLNGERLETGLISKTFAFAILYLVVTMVSALLLSLLESNIDLATALGAALTCISNVGPGFGDVGPAGSFAEMRAISKLMLTLTMIIGRLELYTMLVMLLPSFWKNK